MSIDSQELGLRIIEFDPMHPQPEFFSTATALAATLSAGLAAEPVAFPAHLAPTLDTPTTLPDPSDPLPQADVVIVTWTLAEAETLATLLTPGVGFDDWYQYKSNLGHYIPLVIGKKAPFNNSKSVRFYHSLGMYYPIKLVGKKVICLKSGLHLDHDTYNSGELAPDQLPMLDLWKQIIAETKAKFIITTGTGGAIGADVLLGDAVIATNTVFDCTKQFATKPFKNSMYATSPLPAGFGRPADAMLKENAGRVAESGDKQHADGLPAFYYAGSFIADPKIVTTDTFAFDNTTDSAGLQKLGQACDMGDASLGLVMDQMGKAAPKWAAIRNASDPQIDGTLSPTQQSTEAFNTYTKYGAVTSAASVLATWKLICSHYPVPAPAAFAMAAPSAGPAASLALTRRRSRRLSASHLLMQIVAGSGFSAQELGASHVPADVAQALVEHLRQVGAVAKGHDVTWRLVAFVDDAGTRIKLRMAQVACDTPSVFRGSYLFSGASLVAKEEFAAGRDPA